MKKIFLVSSLLIICNINYAQIALKGRIKDTENNTIPFAHISLKNKAVGTCSNEFGYFRFIIDSINISDTVCISSIGYNNHLLNPQNLNENDSVFYLEKASYEIKAAIVLNNMPTANEIIKKVVKSYKKNYPKTGYQAKAYFQDIVYNYAINADQEVARITEAAVTIQESGVGTTKEVKLRVDELRNSKNFIESNKKVEWLIKLMFGGLQNPIIEMYNEFDLTKKSFLISFLQEHRTNFDRIDFIDTIPVYVIKFNPKEPNSLYNYDYKIYVDTRNYAILKEEFNKTLTPEFQKLIGLKEPVAKQKIKLYKKIGNKYYPYLLEYLSGVKDQGFMFSKEEQFVRHSFIMINEIIPKSKDFKRIKWREIEDENDLLYNREFIYNNDFWDNFNVLYTQEEVTKARNNLKLKD